MLFTAISAALSANLLAMRVRYLAQHQQELLLEFQKLVGVETVAA
jgi:hypothetical protein